MRGVPGGAQSSQTTPPSCTTTAVCAPGPAAARAVLEARRPAGEGERAQQVGVEREARAVLAPGERTQRADEQQVLLQRPLVLGELVGGLDHGVRRRVRRVVLR